MTDEEPSPVCGIDIPLDGLYKTFSTKVGVNFSERSSGSVVFKVLVDGEEKYNSGKMSAGTALKNATIDVQNKKVLTLIVEGVTINNKVCANWADAKLTLNNSTVNYLSDILRNTSYSATTSGSAVKRGQSANYNPLKLKNEVFENGLGTCGETTITIPLNKKYDRFLAVVGVNSEESSNSYITYKITDGTTVLKEGEINKNSPVQLIDVEVKNKETLVLKITGSDVAVDWANARLMKTPAAVVDSNPFRFAGEYWDEESGTYYLRNRRYNPRTSRMLTPDPYWNPGNMIYGSNPTILNGVRIPNMVAIMASSNLYVYCNNDPINYVDPWGLAPNYQATGHKNGQFAYDADGVWFGTTEGKWILVPNDITTPAGYNNDGSKKTTTPANNTPPKTTLLPVGGFSTPSSNHTTVVTNWGNTYAPKSNEVEYGSIIYEASSLGITTYFMGETYQGYQTENWYTVINGLGAGLVTGSAISAASNLTPVNIRVAGFAHTHPIGHTNAPSGPDIWMKRIGNIIGIKIFPIAVYDSVSGKVSINYY